MKNLEKLTVCEIVENGAVVETYSVACHGSATYRVWMGKTPVQSVFDTVDAAAEYAIRCAKDDARVLIGRAHVVTVSYSVMSDAEDDDAGDGCFVRETAVAKCRELQSGDYPDAEIVVFGEQYRRDHYTGKMGWASNAIGKIFVDSEDYCASDDLRRSLDLASHI